MKFFIQSKKSKSGNSTVYFPVVLGRRISNTNFRRKWEAESLAKNFIAHYGEERILKMINK